MLRFLFLLAILALSVFAGLKVADDPGYALFASKHWTVEMPLWFALVSFVVILFLLYVGLRMFDGIDNTWSRWKNWLWMRRKHKAYNKASRGLLELIEANWKNAENLLMESVDQSEAPLINFLGAAKAAHERGAYERRDAYVHKAYDISPEYHVAVSLIQAELQLNQGKYEQALDVLNKLRTQVPKHKVLLKLLERIYIHLGEWENLIKLIPQLYKAKLISAEQMELLEIHAYQELLNSTISTHTINEIWFDIPKRLTKNPVVITSYVKHLSDYPESQGEVEELIIKTLKTSYQKDLVIIFGRLTIGDPIKHLKIAEEWLKQYGEHSELYMTLARLSLRCQIWGKAKNYFDQCIRLESLPEAYLEYGNLLLQLDDKDTAVRVYQEGLVHSVKVIALAE